MSAFRDEAARVARAHRRDPEQDRRDRMRGLLGPRWLQRRAARAAFVRCYGVPYLKEINRREHAGMALLERRGEVVRDDGGLDLHWHLRVGKRP